MSSTVLVTGASGFVALHCVALLLSKGYTVIGTVRSQQQADKVTSQFTKQIGKAPALSFAIVKDIAEDGAFDQVFKDNKQIKYVLHTASPFLYGLTDLEAGYLTPAVHGTVGVLGSIEKYAPQVEKVVITSSFASICDFAKFASDPSFVHTEATWNPVEWADVKDSIIAYVASKKLAERAAWDFVKEHDVKFTLNTVCPPMVYGPQQFDEDAAAEKLNTSAQDIKNLLSIKEAKDIPQGPIFPGVDVRDVAAFHVLPLEKDIGGERLFPIATPASSPVLGLDVIAKHLPELDGKVYKPSKEEIEKDAAQGWKCDNSKSCELLGGYKFIPYETQLTDAIKQILRAQA